MEKKRYAVVKVIDGVTYYYMRHPGTLSWHRGHFLGYWTKRKTKATEFYDQSPEDWPKHRFYQTANDFIISVLGYTHRTHTPDEWFKDAYGGESSASHAASLYHGRAAYNLKLNRWLFELSVSSNRLSASGEFYYVDLDTGEKHSVHQIETDLSKHAPFIEHPAKKAKKIRRYMSSEAGQSFSFLRRNTCS